MTPRPPSPLSLVVLAALLFSAQAFAQADLCKSGMKCRSRDFTSTSKGGAAYCAQGPNASWGWSTGTSVSTLGWSASTDSRCALAGTALISMSINETVVSSNTSGGWRAGTSGFQAADGSLAQTSFSWSADPNTGFYRTAADTFAAVCGGSAIATYRTIGQQLINGSAASPSLHFNGNSATGVFYGQTGGVGLAQAGTQVMEFQTAQPTAFQGLAKSAAVDSLTGRLYFSETSNRLAEPSYDLGGFPHPVLQRQLYGLTVGYESTATPTFYPVAPRLGASSATVTVVDAAAATAVSLGSNPHIYSARGSVTAAAAGSISSLITTAYIRAAGRSPRWCQRVAISSGTSIRVWAGIASALPGSTSNPATSHESFRYDTDAGDTKWQYCYGNGAGTTCGDAGVAPNLSGYELLCIDCREGGTTACTWWINGAAVARVTAGLGAGYPLAPYYSVEARAASARTLWAGDVSVELH